MMYFIAGLPLHYAFTIPAQRRADYLAYVPVHTSAAN